MGGLDTRSMAAMKRATLVGVKNCPRSAAPLRVVGEAIGDLQPFKIQGVEKGGSGDLRLRKGGRISPQDVPKRVVTWIHAFTCCPGGFSREPPPPRPARRLIMDRTTRRVNDRVPSAPSARGRRAGGKPSSRDASDQGVVDSRAAPEVTAASATPAVTGRQSATGFGLREGRCRSGCFGGELAGGGLGGFVRRRRPGVRWAPARGRNYSSMVGPAVPLADPISRPQEGWTARRPKTTARGALEFRPRRSPRTVRSLPASTASRSGSPRPATRGSNAGGDDGERLDGGGRRSASASPASRALHGNARPGPRRLPANR